MRRNTAGAHLHIRPNSPRRHPGPPESEPPAKRRDRGSASTSITGSSGSQVSGTDGTDRGASRFGVQTLMSRPTPGRGRRGGGIASGAVGAVPPDRTLEEVPLPVVAEALQNPIPAGARVGADPVTADALPQELESGVVQNVGSAKETATEQIRVLDAGGSDTLRTVPVVGYTSLCGSTIVSSQTRCKYLPQAISIPLANFASFGPNNSAA